MLNNIFKGENVIFSKFYGKVGVLSWFSISFEKITFYTENLT